MKQPGFSDLEYANKLCAYLRVFFICCIYKLFLFAAWEIGHYPERLRGGEVKFIWLRLVRRRHGLSRASEIK